MTEKIILLLVAYFIGSISPAYLLAKYYFGFDIRSKGSGNPGTTNALRTMGKKAALVTLVLDVSKGILAAFLGSSFVSPDFGAYTGLMAVLGHNFPIFLKFKGGKGVATTIGVVGFLSIKTLVFCFIPGFIVLALTKIVSLASITGFVCLLISSLYLGFTAGFSGRLLVFIFIGLLNIYRHSANIDRILKGTEKKII
ncbi:MAG: glycerol-3-phosphate 1-O-acyltransferase PlsY [Bacillota bacterium]|nr:glycerol-3-phosphate 1-O-acyltransferase PlsY [Bacillota bacterium]